jgi:hypothetical protein
LDDCGKILVGIDGRVAGGLVLLGILQGARQAIPQTIAAGIASVVLAGARLRWTQVSEGAAPPLKNRWDVELSLFFGMGSLCEIIVPDSELASLSRGFYCGFAEVTPRNFSSSTHP